MRKTFILSLLFTIFSIYGYSQIAVTLNLPDPCASVGINEDLKVEKEVDFTLSPNPSNGVFSLKIKSSETIGSVTVEVLSVQGKNVLSEKIFCNSSTSVKEYNLSHLQKGVYIIYLSGKNLKGSKKFILN